MTKHPASAGATAPTTSTGPTVALPGGRGRLWVPLALALAGVLVLVYPVVATQLHNYEQHQFAEKYDKQVADAPPQTLQADLARARAYNATLQGVPIVDPWLARVSRDPKSRPYMTYLGVLARFDAMARIRVPSVGIDLPVYHGTTDRVLANGAGHLYGTSLPVGGVSTHAVLTSHRGLSTATLFDHLPDVKVGDLMYVNVLGETLAYQVDRIKTVRPNQLEDLTKVEGKDYLTLMTCTPYAVNSHRLLVRGHRVPYDAASARPPANKAVHLEGWMYRMLAGAAAGLVVLALIIVREVRLRRRLRRASGPGRDDAAPPLRPAEP